MKNKGNNVGKISKGHLNGDLITYLPEKELLLTIELEPSITLYS